MAVVVFVNSDLVDTLKVEHSVSTLPASVILALLAMARLFSRPCLTHTQSEPFSAVLLLYAHTAR